MAVVAWGSRCGGVRRGARGGGQREKRGGEGGGKRCPFRTKIFEGLLVGVHPNDVCELITLNGAGIVDIEHRNELHLQQLCTRCVCAASCDEREGLDVDRGSWRGWGRL